MKLDKAIGTMRQEADRIKEGLKNQILALPDNPNITRRFGSGAFAVSSSQLGKSWSPFYHDFLAQYEILVKLINETDLMKLPAVLAEIVATGKLKVKYRGTVTFNPEVIKHLVDII